MVKTMKLFSTLLSVWILVACGGGNGGHISGEVPPLYSLGGSISGMGNATGLSLANGTETLAIAANATAFTFATKLAQSASYNITVTSQPAGLTCSITGGAGTISDANVNNVSVTCVALPALALFAGSMEEAGSLDGSGAKARFFYPGGIATDSAGNFYVADTNNGTVRKITPTGVVSTLAGTARVFGYTDGIGAAASFDRPRGIATDSAGNVYVADAGNNIIRKITPTGTVSTLAGTAGVEGHADGIGVAASFNQPWGIATDSTGNVYVADTGNHAIRKISPAGMVTTLAGVPGRNGFVAGPLPGLLSNPENLVIKGSSLYITMLNGIAVVTNLP